MAFPLLDRLLDVLRRRVGPMETVGHSGTVAYSGFIQEREKNPALTGREKYHTYSEVLVNTAIVAAGVRYFLNLISKAEWRAEPASDKEGDPLPGAEEIADKFNMIIGATDTPWNRIVRRAGLYPFWGFSVQEWTARRLEEDPAVIGLRDVEPRAQLTIERWDLDMHGEVHGVVQRSPWTQLELYIPRNKIVYLVDDTLNDSPEGIGLFRHIADPARRLQRYEQLEGWGYETDLRGVPVGRAPFTEMARLKKAGKLTEADEVRLLGPIRSFIEKHIKSPVLGALLESEPFRSTDAAATPSSHRMWDIELLKAGSTSQAEVAQTIQRLNREIARIMGVESILLGESGSGSLAMSKDKSAAFALVVSTTVKALTEAFEKDLVKPLMRLNGWDMKLKPSLKTEAIQFREVTEITEALEQLARAGAPTMPGDPAVNVVRETLGLPKEDPEMVAEDALIRTPEELRPNAPPPGEDEEEQPPGKAPAGKPQGKAPKEKKQ